MQAESVPKVSVCVVTYNQEKYIAQCLQSLVDQVTNFTFEILVADDCSTDGTQEIIKEFSDKYPRIFKLFLHERNIGAYENFRFIHEQASAEYIAHMDGDDYALPGKLQSQVDFLDANEDCNIVWHPVLYQQPDGTLVEPKSEAMHFLYGKKFYRKDIASLIAIGVNSSKMYRSCLKFPYPEFEVVDYFANIEHVGDGYAALSSSCALGVYRVGIGIASSGSKTREILIKTFLYFAKKYPELRPEISAASAIYFLGDLKNGRPTYKNFFKVFMRTASLKFFFVFAKTIHVSSKMKVPK